ncbi:ubiquitin-related domain-containing protein [Mycena epipterygia]|nr:ubiquitin-related domain-containing protein [Mycena epipterygia]
MTVQLFAKTLTNTTYTLQVSLNEPVLLLKQQIEKKGGLPPYLQRFVFRERHLEDSRSLSDYNIKEDDIVHLIWRLRGGGQDPSYHKAVGYAVVLHPWDGDMRVCVTHISISHSCLCNDFSILQPKD